jgi:hypothetical protein
LEVIVIYELESDRKSWKRGLKKRIRRRDMQGANRGSSVI